MIEQILPGGVAAVEAFEDPPDATLFPEEAAVIVRAVAKRRQEFSTVRACARAALARLGVPPVPILPGPRGAPGWPAGIAGSMTHCAGYRAAAVAWQREYATLGIDAEPHGPLPSGVLDMIALPAEVAWCTELAGSTPDVRWDRLLFSAKESVYKAWYPLTGQWLDFSEAEVTVDAGGGFSARLLVPGPTVDGRQLPGFSGRWLVAGELVLTAVAVPARP